MQFMSINSIHVVKLGAASFVNFYNNELRAILILPMNQMACY